MAFPYSTRIILLIALFLGCTVFQLQASHHFNVQLPKTNSLSKSIPSFQPYRTGYHFQSPKNWINDPNGPMSYKGIYHLFYQYNPNGVQWGPPVWAHSTSTDLVNWTPHPIAIAPQGLANFNGSWSGSVTMLGNKPVILFTGLNKQNIQVQDLAVPKDLSDPYLKEWIVVRENPLIAPDLDTKEYNYTAFRDPTTAWILPDGHWRILLGSKRGDRGLALLFRSKDFKHWTMAKHPLYSLDGTGNWECPDFFPVYSDGATAGLDTSVIGPKVKHVFKVSLDLTRHDVYSIGSYDTKNDRYVPNSGSIISDSGLRYDYGKYYASKTFYDAANKRRILLGWANESSTVADDVIKGWSGIHHIPRTVWLEKSGKQLIQWPVPAIESLRGKPVHVPVKVIKAKSVVEVTGVTAAQADVEISFKVSSLKNVEKFDPSWTDPQLICSQKGASVKGGLGPFGLLTLASKGLEEHTAVFFRIFKSNDKLVVLMCSDQSRSSLNPTTDKTPYGTFVNVDPVKEGLSLRALIDHSVVESFGAKGKNVITTRVYPKLAIDNKAHLYAFNYGSEDVEVTGLTAWSMKKAHIN